MYELKIDDGKVSIKVSTKTGTCATAEIEAKTTGNVLLQLADVPVLMHVGTTPTPEPKAVEEDAPIAPPRPDVPPETEDDKFRRMTRTRGSKS